MLFSSAPCAGDASTNTSNTADCREVHRSRRTSRCTSSAIDLATIFPEDINVLLPEALFFYPPVALCAKVACHLAPLAMLTVLASRGATPYWAYAVVVYVEPVFQAANSWDAGLQAWLVFGNVLLISAVQIFLFVRHGFAAMIALRLVFYLFWHLIWGSIRHFLLF